MQNKVYFAFFLLILASFFWSGNFLTAKLAYNFNLSPLKLSFYRWLLAFIIILPFTLNSILKNYDLIKSNLLNIIILSILGVTIFNSFTYIALTSTIVINASIMGSIAPLLIIFFSWLILNTKPSSFQFLGILLSIFGVIFIILKGNIINLFYLNFTPGDIWMLIAVICWGLYSVLLKKLDSSLPQIPTLSIMIFFGLIFIFPFYFYESLSGSFYPNKQSDFFMIFYVAIFAGIFSFIFWNKGVSIIGANRAGIFLHLIPLFSSIWAIFILGERFSIYHAFGISFIIAGIILANYKTSK
tara:strand:+ start:190 stop:1086 length:897 start_codon:yes stop_codon:yes gene_type:complete